MSEAEIRTATPALAGERPPWRRRLAMAAAAAVTLLTAAWLLRVEGPREPSYPTMEPRAPFPELASGGGTGPGGEEDRAGKEVPTSRFEAALRRAASPAPEPADESPPEEQRPGLTFPIGGGLVADLPGPSAGGSGSWRWAGRAWGSLAVHLTTAGRPDALVYAEPFSPLWAQRPSAELLRFHLTVLPASVVELPLVGSLWRAVWNPTPEASGENAVPEPSELAERARHRQLSRTSTRGRGVGFQPGEEGATGSRWVGRNPQGALLRLRRFDGAWRGVRTGRAEPTGVPAYMVMGSATAPDGLFGAHLAVLCSRAPECPVAEALASLLASIRVEEPGRIERLRQSVPDSLEELASRASLEVEEPAPPAATSPPTAPTP